MSLYRLAHKASDIQMQQSSSAFTLMLISSRNYKTNEHKQTIEQKTNTQPDTQTNNQTNDQPENQMNKETIEKTNVSHGERM